MINQIIQFANANGLNPDSIIPDGKVHKFKEFQKDTRKSAWYICFQNHTNKSGENYYYAIFGSWRSDQRFVYKDDSVTMALEDLANMKKQLAQAKKKVAIEKENSQNETAELIKAEWETFRDNGKSDYLDKKKIKPFGIRFNSYGSIVIPMRDIDGKLWSTQTIDYQGNKKFHYGGKILGTLHTIGNIENELHYITEGYATGASIYNATINCTHVAFMGANLVNVAKILKKRFPDKVFVICGDDDKSNEKNPGRKFAEKAAEACLGKAIFPVFKNEETKPTDYNDLHVLETLKEVERQLKNTKVKKMALYCLGFKEKEYFFTSTQNRQIVPVTTFSERDFLDLMELKYWESQYPTANENNSNKVDWTNAKSELMLQCRKHGLFKEHFIRGAGVWVDQGRIVLNMGDHLIVDGNRKELGDIKSKYFYTLGAALTPLSKDPLSVEECKILVDACTGFKWAKSEFGILLAGILAISRISGSLLVRPHCWVTGGSSTGKSTLFEKCIYPIIGANTLYVLGGTTEAGVRQSLKHDAVPLLFDEIESNGGVTDEKVKSIVELARASWSESRARIVKGSATGNADGFSVKFSAIFSSIRVSLDTEADKSRFTVLELSPHGNNKEHWQDLQSKLLKIDEVFAERLFARITGMIPTILENYKIIRKAFVNSNSRFGEKYGMIMAGFAALCFNGVLKDSEAKWFVNQIDLEDEKEKSVESDHVDALNHLLTTKVNFDCDHGKKSELIGSLISDVIEKEIYLTGPSTIDRHKELNEGNILSKEKALRSLGIRVLFKEKEVAIRYGSHAELEKVVFQKTKWSNKHGASLLRLENAYTKNTRFVRTDKAIRIPLSFFN